MLIAQILSAKGSTVVGTRPEATIAEVAGLLKQKRIGAVVVTDRTAGCAASSPSATWRAGSRTMAAGCCG